MSKRETYKEALSKYVPFHFFAKNPFDGCVCKDHGSDNMVIITILRELHKRCDFYIIPSHPLNKDTPDIYDYTEGLKEIRWDILDGEIERDYHDPEIRKACMAECIVPHVIPCKAFFKVYVFDKNVKKKIMAMENSESIDIVVNPNMFP